MTGPLVDPDEEFTELVDGEFPRVDLVGRAANGTPRFLIAKSAVPGSFGVVEAEVVRGLIRKADADPLASVATADLKRQALEGTADQKKAALMELGKRSAAGLEEPGPAPEPEDGDAAKQRAAWEQANAANAPEPVLDPAALSLTPAPPGEVGLPADAAAIAKASAYEGTLSPAGAVLAVLHARGAAVRKDRAAEVQSATVSQAAAHGLAGALGPRSTFGDVASPEVQAARGSVLDTDSPVLRDASEVQVAAAAVAANMEVSKAEAAGTLSPYGAMFARDKNNQRAAEQITAMRARGVSGVVRKASASDALRAMEPLLTEQHVAKRQAIAKQAAAGAISREQEWARLDAIDKAHGLRIAQGRMASRVVKAQAPAALAVNAKSRRVQGRG
jgi:hypothetical protein